MDRASRSVVSSREVAVLAAVAVLLGWAFFAGGASGTGATASLGSVAVILSGLASIAWSRGSLTLPRLDPTGLAAAAAAVGLVAWTGLSVWWSIAGDRSWDALAKGIVLLAFGFFGLVVASLPGRPLRALALVLAAAIGAVLLWALLGKAIPSIGPDDAGRVARLKGSIGYWNALALLADAALGLGLWLLGATSGRTRRLGGAVLAYAATVAILLTQSRAGVIAALAVIALVLLLAGGRLEQALRTALAAGPAIVVSGWALTRPALVEDGGANADRVADGAVLGVLMVLGAVVVVVLAVSVPVARLVAERGREVTRGLVGSLAVVAAIGVVGLLLSVGNPLSWAADQLTGTGEVVNAPGRLGSLETNNRTVWWGEAWENFSAHPVGGTGARTFELARKQYRSNAQNVTEPHSVPLQLLSDLGVPGFALGLAFVLALVLGLRAALRRLPPGERAAAVGLAALPVAFFLHSLVDYDLDFLAVAAPAALVSGALIGAGRPTLPAPRSRRLVPAAAVACVAAAVWVLVAPALSGRFVDEAYRQADAGRLSAAASSARRAESLNPLSPEPLYARATIASLRGDDRAAEALYERATRLQPENPDTWYELGVFRQIALGNQCSAYGALNEAYTLDQSGSRFSPGSALDIARDAVNDPDDPACGR